MSFIELIGGVVTAGFYLCVTAARGQLGSCFINSSKIIIKIQFYDYLSYMLVSLSLSLCIKFWSVFFNPLLQMSKLRLRKAE